MSKLHVLTCNVLDQTLLILFISTLANLYRLTLAFFNIKSTCPTKPNLVHFQRAVCRIAKSDTHNTKSGSLIDRTYD